MTAVCPPPESSKDAPAVASVLTAARLGCELLEQLAYRFHVPHLRRLRALERRPRLRRLLFVGRLRGEGGEAAESVLHTP